MTRKRSRLMVPWFVRSTVLLPLVLAFTAAPMTVSTSPRSEEVLPPKIEAPETEVEEVTPEEPEVAEQSTGETPSPSATQSKPRWADYPNRCETFTVIEGAKRVENKRTGKKQYPVRFRRNRYDRKFSHQKRTRDLIRMVAREMGADEDGQYLLEMMAHHESSWNPEAIHILNRDLQANLEAWEHYSYDRGRELRIQEKLRKTSARSKEFWKLKSQLWDLRLYKGNPFWTAQLEYLHKIPKRTLHGVTTEPVEFTERRSVWAYGYGLFGMNSVLYTHVWDNQAPPWILCGDEGIVATVAAVWAVREQQRDCTYLTNTNPEKWGTDGGNARGLVRRFARGKCGKKKLGKAWQRLMAANSDHVDWNKRPDLGNKFPRYEMYRRGGKWRYRYEQEIDAVTGKPKVDPETGKPVYKRDGRGRKIKVPTDREAILAHMRAKAEEKGLLHPAPLKRKKPDSAPVIVAQSGVMAAP